MQEIRLLWIARDSETASIITMSEGFAMPHYFAARAAAPHPRPAIRSLTFT
jgi:hypothetical protein